MMNLLHTLLSEYQQVPSMPIRDAGLSFVDSMSALTPHPSTPNLVLYASDRSKTLVLAVHEMWSKKYLCAVLVFLRQHNARVYERSRLQKSGLTVNYDCGALWSKLFIRSIFSHFMYLNCVRSNLQRNCCCCMP